MGSLRTVCIRVGLRMQCAPLPLAAPVSFLLDVLLFLAVFRLCCCRLMMDTKIQNRRNPDSKEEEIIPKLRVRLYLII